jgi:C4-dicarboxylate-specific signal transduction histidine kinase
LRFLKAQPIRRQIFAVTGLLIVPFAIAVAWSAEMTRRERELEVRDQAGSVAVTAAAYLNQYLSGFDAMATVLARHPAVAALDRPRCDELFAAILRERPILLNIILTDVNGTVQGTGVKTRTSLGSTVALAYVQQVVATQKPVVSELTTGQVSGKPTVILAYPVFDAAAAIVGTLGLGVDVAALQTVFNTIPLPEGSVITVTDSASRVLARSRDAERYIGTALENNARPPNEVAINQERTGIDGIPRFYGNHPIARGSWLLSVGIPTRVVLERVAPLWQRNLSIVLSGLGVVLFLSLWLSRTLSTSLNGLRLAAQRIAGGDLSPPIRTGVPNRELNDLQDAFITMAASLRDAHQALDHQVEQERKMRETLQSLQRQVVRQERLAAVGVLVSGVAHELNNPLQAILGTAELLERKEALSKEVLEEIAFVKTQSGRAREIIRNLSRFSSQQSGPPALVDLRDVIAEVVQLRQRDLSNSSIVLEVEIRTARLVYANFTELEQVTLNFVINAQQSIEADGRARGRITIRLYDSARKVRLEVQDDGPGVATEDEPKLFQPFFTTKPVGKGTGLGLSVSYGIIESYGGAIGHKDNDWGGATFFFELPVADASTIPHSDDRASLLHGPLRAKL